MIIKALKISGNILLILLIFLSILSIYSLLQSKNNTGQPTSIFGHAMLTVLSGSMEPLIEPGDIIVVKDIDPEAIEVNDIITYKKSPDTLVTHRVVDIVKRDGNFFYQTKGDANNIIDQSLVSSKQLIGKLKFHIPKLGYIASFIKSPLGLTLIILIPLLILTIGKLINIYRHSQRENINT